MGFLNDLINRVQTLNIEEQIERVVIQSESSIEDAQREQWLHGEDKNGNPIGTYRSPGYAQAKHSMNPLPGLGYVDLRKTGAFYRSVTASVIGDELIIDAHDSKTPEIVAKYGDDIFGLNGEFRRRVVTDEIRPLLFKNIKSHLRFG